MKKIKVGLIGCGGRLRGVTANLLKHNKGIEVVALSDPSADSIASAQKSLCKNKSATVYKKYQDLVKSDDVDWVMVGSWNCFHKEHVLAAFKAGKHVFCEKPLATNFTDVSTMYKAYQKADRLFNIGFTLRYSPHYRKIKSILEKGTIGEIISMESNETLGPDHGGYIMGDWRRLTKNAGTHLLEKCSHDIDLANWMVDSRATRVASFGGLDFFTPKNVHHIKRVGRDPKTKKMAYQTWPGPDRKNPFTAKKDIIDNQVAIIEYENGVRATFHANCNAAIPERRMYICGSEGTIQADVITGEIKVRRIGYKEKTKNVPSGSHGGHGGGDAVLAVELGRTMKKGVAPSTGLENGMMAAVTCFAIDKAMDTGKVVDVAPYWKRLGL